MKLLWVEDQPNEDLAGSLFKELLLKNFDEEFDPDNDIRDELPGFFVSPEYGISVCLSFHSFVSLFFGFRFDFDIFIIDINLSAKEPVSSDLPEGILDRPAFLKKAGFYIWNLLVRNGVPEDSIAFMTGNTDSIQEFNSMCISSSIPRLKDENVFDKSETGYEKFRNWISEKKNSRYIQLRRGILEGIQYHLDSLEKNTSEILFNVTVRNDGTAEPVDTDYAGLYLEKLRFYFLKEYVEEPLRMYSFLTALSSEWERSYIHSSYTDTDNPFSSKRTPPEEKFFHYTGFWIMKNLRNAIAHSCLEDSLSERDIAFFFIIAMRTFFKTDLGKVYDYEKILFTAMAEEKILNKSIRELQERSMNHILNLCYRKPKEGRMAEFKKIGNRFLESHKKVFSRNRHHEEVPEFTKDLSRDDIRENSKKILMNSFWFIFESGNPKSEFLTAMADAMRGLG